MPETTNRPIASVPAAPGRQPVVQHRGVARICDDLGFHAIHFIDHLLAHSRYDQRHLES